MKRALVIIACAIVVLWGCYEPADEETAALRAGKSYKQIMDTRDH